MILTVKFLNYIFFSETINDDNLLSYQPSPVRKKLLLLLLHSGSTRLCLLVIVIVILFMFEKTL